MTPRTSTSIRAIALAAGVVLLAIAVRSGDPSSLTAAMRAIGRAWPLVLLPAAAWHVLRTLAWQQSFPADARPPFPRAFRVRLAAEAFSYVTIRGVAGEPLKVLLLEDETDSTTAAAAVALERMAYLLVTAAIISIASIIALVALPLTTRWIAVFAACATTGLALAVLPVWLVRRRAFQPRDHDLAVQAASTPSSRWRRWLQAFARQFAALLRSEPRRLRRLAALEAAAYGTMALEVWIVLWANGSSITMLGALAIETFTRVASFASAFIPGNVGALEASNVVAAGAMHVAAGALPLALARRVRGLFFCAAGFLVYPRSGARSHAGREPQEERDSRDSRHGPVLAIVEGHEHPALLTAELGGLPIGERMVRAAVRAGYRQMVIWSPQQASSWRGIARDWCRAVDVRVTGDPAEWQSAVTSIDSGAHVVALAGTTIASPQLLADAAAGVSRGDRPCEVPAGAGWPRSGVYSVTVEALRDPAGLAAQLSLPDAPAEPAIAEVVAGDAHLSLRVRDRADLDRAEARLRLSIFKPTDAHLARFNRRVSLPISMALIRWLRCSPHAMSTLVMVLGLAAGWTFSIGRYGSGVLAGVLSLAASVLDGCDGELARLQMKESSFGCWLDTFGDYTYYLAIFAGMTVGAVRQTGWAGFWWIGAAMIGGTIATLALLVLLRHRITGGRPESLRTRTAAHFHGSGKPWTRIVATLSTVATRATAPYGILLLALLHAVPVVVVIAAAGAQIYWISLAIELKRLLARAPQPITAQTGMTAP